MVATRLHPLAEASRTRVKVLGSDQAWSTLVVAGLSVAGAQAERADPGEWRQALAALRVGQLDRIVVLDHDLARTLDPFVAEAPALGSRIIWRATGAARAGEVPRGLPRDSTLDELVRAVLGRPSDQAPTQCEVSLAGVSIPALLGAAAILRPTLKISLTTPEGPAALCLCDGLVRAAGIGEHPLAVSEGLADDPSLSLLMHLWASHPDGDGHSRLDDDLGFVCEYGDLFAESEAHRRHVAQVLRELLQRDGSAAVFEVHEPATSGRDLVAALRDACLELPPEALARIVAPQALVAAPGGLPLRLRDAFPPTRFGRLFFLIEEPVAVEEVLGGVRLPRSEALAALAVGVMTGAVEVTLPSAEATPVLADGDPEGTALLRLVPRVRRGERVATKISWTGLALASAACGDARRFIEGLTEAAQHAKDAGRRLRLRGTRFEPVGEVVEHLVLGYRIGSGGMGEVLLGVHGSQGNVLKVVAVKRCSEQSSGEPTRLAMFLAEARLSASLAHPNIVGSSQLLRAGDQYLLVMEFVHGLSGAELLGRLGNERLAPELVAWIGAETARGLHYAHNLEAPDGRPMGLVHRDVAPSNIMLGLDGSVKLIDFGVASARSREQLVTDLRSRTGRLGYMAPEGLTGDPVGSRADQFSLGVSLYELLTGRRPFLGTPDLSPAQATLSGDHVPLLVARPEVPPGLAYAVERAMALDPRDRFPDCDALRQTLATAAPIEGGARDRVAELVRGAATDVLPYEIEAIARMRRAAAALLATPGDDGSETGGGG